MLSCDTLTLTYVYKHVHVHVHVQNTQWIPFHYVVDCYSEATIKQDTATFEYKHVHAGEPLHVQLNLYIHTPPPLPPLYNWCCYNVVCVYVYNSCTCKLQSAYDCHPCTCNIVCITLMNLKSLSVIFLARLAGSSTGMVPVLTGAGMDGECSNKPFS